MGGTDYSQLPTMTEIVYEFSYDRPRGHVERMMNEFRKTFGLKPTAPVRPTNQALTDGGKARPPREPQPAQANRPVDQRAMYNRMIRHHPACNQVKALLNMEGCLRAYISKNPWQARQQTHLSSKAGRSWLPDSQLRGTVNTHPTAFGRHPLWNPYHCLQ